MSRPGSLATQENPLGSVAAAHTVTLVWGVIALEHSVQCELLSLFYQGTKQIR